MNRLRQLLLIMLFYTPLNAATYYLATTGDDGTATGTIESPFGTFQHAVTHMSGGDTLIIRDGTYQGASNILNYDNCPPNGTSGAWTIVKAENDGEAIFDGQGVRDMIMIDASDGQNRYWQIEGIIGCNSYGSGAITFNGCQYIKLLRCGAYNAQGNSAGISFGRGSHHCLIEGCYAYGAGRYKFLVYQSSFTIVRNCVARFDGTAATDNIAFFSIYSGYKCEVQNCIALDGDQTSAWTGTEEEHAGFFYLPATDAPGQYVNFTNCIGVNSHMGCLGIGGNYNSDDVTFKNCSFWHVVSDTSHGQFMLYMRGNRTLLTQCTFGNLAHEYIAFNSYSDDPNATTMKNNIVYQCTGGTLLSSIETEDYNDYYLNEDTGTVGAHSLSVNPVWSAGNSSGALKYITRTETNNNLATSGEGSIQIGANCTKMFGASGTLWGETGYATEQSTDMWPFPNEALIKTKMAAYTATNVTGARGFCASGKQINGTDDITLTSYIWEYLGNEIPSDIYGDEEPDPVEYSPTTIKNISIQGIQFN